MATHLSIGRTLSVSLIALVGLALVTGVVHFLNSPGSDVQAVPGPKSTATAPQSLVEPSSPPKKVVPIPTRAPRASRIATLFEKSRSSSSGTPAYTSRRATSPRTTGS